MVYYLWLGSLLSCLLFFSRSDGFTQSLVRQVSNLIEFSMLLNDLFSEGTSLLRILHNVLYSDFLRVLWTEIIPIDLCHVKQTKNFLFLLLLLLDFDFFFDLLTCK